MKKVLFFCFLFIVTCPVLFAQQSVARKWNEVTLSAIREDLARPPVQARNLFHVAIAMYDAWAAYDANASTYLIGKTLGGVSYPFLGVPAVAPSALDSMRNMAISYAAYRVLVKRYAGSPNAATSLTRFHNLMISLGYDTSYSSANYSSGTPADLGNFIAQQVIQMGLADGAREAQNYSYIDYSPINQALYVDSVGDKTMNDPNRWQPLYITTAFDQGGNPIGSLQKFVCPEWGRVLPFVLDNPVNYARNGKIFPVYLDPGLPPLLDTADVNNSSSHYFKWGHALVAAWSSHLDPDDTVKWDISPRSMGNVQTLPASLDEEVSFYNFTQGGDPGTGYAMNPVTNLPYPAQMVKRGDYARVVSQYWADGPNSETPPGHWFVLLNQVGDHPLFQKKFEGIGPVLNNLEWDVKSYFTLGGALHDAAIAAWGIKGWYDSPRPISMIRKMAMYGQSSSAALPSYHPGGILLYPGYLELVYAGDPLAGVGNIHVGKIKVKAWKGFSSIADPLYNYAGVDWILAENWMPYQRKTFVTPPFSGYVSGHSTYSRAAAEVLTSLTGDPFFPGGMGEYLVSANSNFLQFEKGPSTDIRLQWATYRDASNQSSLSRIWGGIHPPFDDIPGRQIGAQIGQAAFIKAKSYFSNVVLPVSIVQFEAVEKGCSVQLRWSAVAGQNMNSYAIFKSIDGIHFDTPVGQISAGGNSNIVKNYSVQDGHPFAVGFYKLEGKDRSGTIHALASTAVRMNNCPLASGIFIYPLYPNPVQTSTSFDVQSSMDHAAYVILLEGMDGRAEMIQQGVLHAGNNHLQCPLDKWPDGTYLMKMIINGNIRQVQQLVKLN